ncbi:hypothetical protein KFL_008290035 [Klebsormidium nitens]|uniref:Uncharacterized protein n=1 Tax=Klebsormidium nitens TaxID=105231 RepID=A0A1Y1ILA5_KLENI|nr:hypothetical protein KFL_008290035 [Klebsormidium nitens]|eukprot:GAQ91665.1 hypothetical protein KFL_008290035 [Klebsormidium nitens]
MVLAKSSFLIVIVGSRCDDAPAPCRRRCQRPKGLKQEEQPAREVPRGRRFSAADQKAKQQDAPVLEEALNCAAERGFRLRGGKYGGNVRYYCERHGPTKGCFQIDKDRAAWVQGREKTGRKANPACPEREQHLKGSGSPAARRSGTATAESVCADRGARHSPPTTAPPAAASDSESDCGLGAACHQHAASDEAQPGQPPVHRAEGLCALSSGSARFGVQPTVMKSVLVRSAFQGSPTYECGSEKVFYSSAPKSRALIATQLKIGGVESNPGPTQDPDAPSSSSGRPPIPITTAEEVQESVRPKPISTEAFDAWRASRPNPNWVAEAMALYSIQAGQPQGQEPPSEPSAAGEETGPSSSNPHSASQPRSAAAEPAPTDPRPSSHPPDPTSQPRSTPTQPAPTEVARRKRTASSRESSPAPTGTRMRTGSPDEAEAAAMSDEEAGSVDIEETSDETESDEEPTSEDDRGVDDSVLPDAETRDLYRRMEMEEAEARFAEDETPDDALAPMRMEMQWRRARDEAPQTSVFSMAHEDLVAVPEPAVHSDPLTGNEVFKKDGFRVLRVREHETNCFHQTGANPTGRLPGPKFFMQQEAALLNHEAQVVLHKWSGKVEKLVRVPWRSFASYPDWETARSHLEGRHGSVTEIIQNGKPCKPYLDLDGKDGLPFKRKPVTGADGEVVEAGERYGGEEVIKIVEEWAVTVFKEQYDHELQPSSFVWIESPCQTKFSLHLTINQLSPRQLVFGSNTEGALHFARRLKKRLLPWHPAVANLIDLNVYTKDREWRTLGSAKIEKPESVLSCINPAHSWKDALVTWLEPLEAREEVKLPFEVPKRLHERFQNPRVMSERGTERSSQNDEFVKARMLTLLRERLHPSAYEEGLDRYNYRDRAEPCYTGRIHENRQNLTCHLNPNGKIYALCFSQNTEGGDSDVPCVKRAFCLGDLFEDNISYETGAVKVDMEHLTRAPDASTPELVAEVGAGMRMPSDLMKLNTVANE